MAFKITKKTTFKTRVDVDTPNNKAGHDHSSFHAVFNRVSVSEYDDLKRASQQEIMRLKLVGWEDFLNDDGSEIEFNPDNLEMLIHVPEALQGLSHAFWGSVLKAREKNS